MIWQKKVWQIGVQSNCYVMYMWHLDGFSLAKLCSFAKFAKLSPHQTFLLYSIYVHIMKNIYYKLYTCESIMSSRQLQIQVLWTHMPGFLKLFLFVRRYVCMCVCAPLRVLITSHVKSSLQLFCFFTWHLLLINWMAMAMGHRLSQNY